MRAYEEYKESGYDWLGKIPAHWNSVKIREVFTERKSKVSDKDFPPLSVTKSGIVPQLETAAKSDDGDNRKLVRVGDFVINGRSDRKGSSGISSLDGSVSLINHVLTPRANIHPRFVHYLLRSNSFIEEFYKNGRGIVADLWTTRYSEMKAIGLPQPPREEQDAIVRFLDAKCAKIDRLIKLKERQIELLNEKKQNIIDQTVTKGLDPHAPMKDSGVDWIGEIPEGWEVRKIKQLCHVVDCKNRTPEAVSGGSHYAIRTSCIKNGKFTLEGAIETDEKNCTIWNAKGKPQKGDIFFTREAPMGEACIVPDMQNICMGQRVMFFRPFDFDANIILYNIYSKVVKEYIAFESNGSTVGHLRLGQVGNIPIVWMNKETQKEIKEYLAQKIEKIEKSRVSLAKSIEFLNSYKQSFISNVVTGKIRINN